MVPEQVVKSSEFFRLHGDCILEPEIIMVNDKKYLKYLNLGTKWPPKTRVENIRGEIKGNLADRLSLGIYNGHELIKNGEMIYKKMFYHFRLRYILGKGDSNLNNYINNVGIDFEENRTRLEVEGFFQKIFTKLPNSVVLKTLREELARNRVELSKKLKALKLF